MAILSTKYSEAVCAIKHAILVSQHRVAQQANGELLSLYYGIGKYVSEHTRTDAWGTGAIDAISQQLQKELPGLRGFSAAAIRKMRIFYEQWCEYANRSLVVNDLATNKTKEEIRQLLPSQEQLEEVLLSTFDERQQAKNKHR